MYLVNDLPIFQPNAKSDMSSTYTTTCPVVSTVTGAGTTYTKTYTTTSIYKASYSLWMYSSKMFADFRIDSRSYDVLHHNTRSDWL